MKKTVIINLAGFAYNIDEDAFELLQTYIEELKQKLGGGAEANDVISDIEERISELVTEKLKGRQVVAIEMVEEIIAQLGNPDEIAGIHGKSDKESSSSSSAAQGRLRRRLYRNPDGSLIAGVCSGMSEYFAVDPLVFRIIFIALFFAKGVGLFAYLIFWIATPRALTPKQKLEMRGDPVTLQNLGDTIKEEFDTVRENIKRNDTNNFIGKLVDVVGKIAYALLKFFLVFFKVIGIVVGVVLVASMLFVFIVLVSVVFFKGFGLSFFIPEYSSLSLNDFFSSMFEFSTGGWITVPLFLVLAIPIVGLIYGGVRILFNFKARDGVVGPIAAIAWVVSIIVLAVSFFSLGRSLTIRESSQITINLPEFSADNKTIYLKSFSSDEWINSNSTDTYNIFDYSIVSNNGEHRIIGTPSFIIERTIDEEYPVLKIEKDSRGISHSEARQNASDIIYSYEVIDSVLNISPKFLLPNDVKWKGQDVTVKLCLPVGYAVNIDSSIEDIMETQQPYSRYWPDEMVDKTWRMTPNGLRIVR